MKIFIVGGAVRDELLGLKVKDKDFVVVGGTPEAMLHEGYKPVGKDFPVFYTPKHMKNMHLHAPSEKRLKATKAL